MGVFDRQIATAQRLIAKYGQDCGWVKAPADDGSGSPGYPGELAPDAPVPCKIAWFSSKDLGRGSGEFAALMAGIEVPAGKEIGLLAGGIDFVPQDADTIIRGASTNGITSIDRLAPNGDPILYYVTVSL